jgi:predicted membrane protein
VEQFFANWTGDFVLKCIHRRGGQRDVSFFFPLLVLLVAVVVLHRRFFYLFFIAFFSASLLCVFVASIRFNLMERIFSISIPFKMKSNARKIEMKQRTKDTRSEALLRAHAVRDKKKEYGA